MLRRFVARFFFMRVQFVVFFSAKEAKVLGFPVNRSISSNEVQPDFCIH